MKLIPLLLICGLLSGCVMYRSFDRHVRVWNVQNGKSAANEEFRYHHATPWPHFPRNPEPVEVQLDDQGETLVRLPGAFGWIGFGEYSALIQGSQIRDGGTFDLYAASGSGTKQTPWKIQISAHKSNPGAAATGKPADSLGSKPEGGDNPQPEAEQRSR